MPTKKELLATIEELKDWECGIGAVVLKLKEENRELKEENEAFKLGGFHTSHPEDGSRHGFCKDCDCCIMCGCCECEEEEQMVCVECRFKGDYEEFECERCQSCFDNGFHNWLSEKGYDYPWDDGAPKEEDYYDYLDGKDEKEKKKN